MQDRNVEKPSSVDEYAELFRLLEANKDAVMINSDTLEMEVSAKQLIKNMKIVVELARKEPDELYRQYLLYGPLKGLATFLPIGTELQKYCASKVEAIQIAENKEVMLDRQKYGDDYIAEDGCLKIHGAPERQKEMQKQTKADSKKNAASQGDLEIIKTRSGLPDNLAKGYEEFLSTEVAFQKTIQALIDAKKSMLKNYKETPGLSKKDLKDMLGCLSAINDSSKQIIKTLKKGTLGAYEAAVKLILKSGAAFAKFARLYKPIPDGLGKDRQFFSSDDNQSADAYFMGIIQRSMRYPMLVGALIEEVFSVEKDKTTNKITSIGDVKIPGVPATFRDKLPDMHKSLAEFSGRVDEARPQVAAAPITSSHSSPEIEGGRRDRPEHSNVLTEEDRLAMQALAEEGAHDHASPTIRPNAQALSSETTPQLAITTSGSARVDSTVKAEKPSVGLKSR